MNEPVKQRFPWLPLMALSFAYGSAFNPAYIRYFLYDSMIAAMGCTNMQLGFLTTIAVIVGIVAAIPGGWVADKFKTKRIIILSLLAMAPVILMSVLFISLYWVQVLAWGLMGGITGFAFWPAVLKAVRIVGGAKNQSTTFGIFESTQGLAATVGNMIAIGIFAKFADIVWGYKAAHLSMALFCLLSALMVFMFYKDSEEEKDAAAETQVTEKQFKVRDTIILLKNPRLWLVAITLCGVYGLYTCQAYMTPYFTGVLGASLTLTGFFAIMRDYGMKVIGGPIGGLLAQKMGSPSLLNALCLIVASGLIFTISSIKPGGANVVSFVMFFVLFNALICCLAKSTMWAIMDEANIPLNLTGTAIAIITLIAIYVPDGILPLINGWLLDTYADDLPKAYSYYFTILIGMALISAAAALTIFIWRRKDKKCLLESASAEQKN